MDFKCLIKKIIHWPIIRKYLIILKQNMVAHKLRHLVLDCDNNKLKKYHFEKKTSLEYNKIIWQYWAQGYNSTNMPPIIQRCFESIDKYAYNYKIIRLSDENINQYIDIPDWIISKRRNFPIAHYSDLLRCLLLSTYGGIWLDAAVLLTGPIPKYITSSDFFMYERDPLEPNKKYWENTFAYYFGWHKYFKVNALIGILYSKPNNKVITDMSTILLAFWKEYDSIPDYFFFQILFDIYIKRHKDRNCAVVNDCIPHLLRQVINNDTPPINDIFEITKLTTIHSLNYKNPQAINELTTILKSLE